MASNSTTDENFAISARAFCTLIERLDSLSEWEFIIASAERLAALYQSGLLLSLRMVDACLSDHNVEGISMDHWQELYEELGEKLTKKGLYWEVFDPCKKTEPLIASLADDLAGIYGDVKAGLISYEAGHVSEAVCHWRESFLIHWGSHAVDALCYLHRIIATRVMEDL